MAPAPAGASSGSAMRGCGTAQAPAAEPCRAGQRGQPVPHFSCCRELPKQLSGRALGRFAATGVNSSPPRSPKPRALARRSPAVPGIAAASCSSPFTAVTRTPNRSAQGSLCAPLTCSTRQVPAPQTARVHPAHGLVPGRGLLRAPHAAPPAPAPAPAAGNGSVGKPGFGLAPGELSSSSSSSHCCRLAWRPR